LYDRYFIHPHHRPVAQPFGNGLASGRRARLMTALRDTKKAIASGEKFLEDLSKAGARNEKVFHNKVWQEMADSTIKALRKLKNEKIQIERLLARFD
jgi:hypothetical protein